MLTGNKEIIGYLRQLKLISTHIAYRSALMTYKRWRKKFGLEYCIHYLPNGRPFALKSEIRLWAARTDELLRKKPVLQRWRIDRNK
jgi:hypothetical protein